MWFKTNKTFLPRSDSKAQRGLASPWISPLSPVSASPEEGKGARNPDCFLEPGAAPSCPRAERRQEGCRQGAHRIGNKHQHSLNGRESSKCPEPNSLPMATPTQRPSRKTRLGEPEPGPEGGAGPHASPHPQGNPARLARHPCFPEKEREAQGLQSPRFTQLVCD